MRWFNKHYVISAGCIFFRMAPEVAAVETKGGYDHMCDIWAVGYYNFLVLFNIGR